MPPDQPRPSNPEISAQLSELSRELRTAVDDVIALTITLKELDTESAKAEGREPELVAAYHSHVAARERFREIWGRGRKPILTFAMLSNRRYKLLAEFRRLPEHPNVFEVRKFVEFLDVVLQVDSAAATMESGDENRESQEVIAAADKGKSHSEKRGRGRPVEIPKERKAVALQLKESGGTDFDAAKILYGTNQPSKRQCDNVHAILASYCRKYGIALGPA